MNSFDTLYAARLRLSDAELAMPLAWTHPQPLPRPQRLSRRPGVGGRFTIGVVIGALLALPLWAAVIWVGCVVWGVLS